jgi:hypothetical protein
MVYSQTGKFVLMVNLVAPFLVNYGSRIEAGMASEFRTNMSSNCLLQAGEQWCILSLWQLIVSFK